MNRTGVATSPKLTAAMLEGQNEFPPDTQGDERQIALSRSASVQEWDEPIGSVPPPTTVKGVVKTGLTAMTGESPTLLIDKLGARLAFERSGVRLYEVLISKLDATGGFDGGPTRAQLESILGDEFQHFRMLVEALQHLGADPTVMTPGADLQATLTSGALQVLVEPRTNLAQCLEAALTIELLDNDSWEMLTALAEQAGQVELAKRFQHALAQENIHLVNIRTWLNASQGITAG
jgi:rubrerythrin